LVRPGDEAASAEASTASIPAAREGSSNIAVEIRTASNALIVTL